MVVLFASPPARAQTSVPLDTVPLDTVIDASIASICPSASAVSERLDAYLAGASVDVDATAALEVAPSSGGFTVILSLRRGELSSERTIVGVACVEVLEAAVLVIAIALDPDVLDRAPPVDAPLVDPTTNVGPPLDPEPAPPVASAVAAPIAAEEPSPREALGHPVREADAAREGDAARLGSPRRDALPEDEPAEPALVVRAHAAMTVAIVPAPSFGALVDVGVRLSWLELSLGVLWASETVSEIGPGRGGVFALYLGTLRVGAVLRFSWLELVPQVRLGVGAMTARGVGVDRPRAEASEWLDVAGGLEVRARWELGPLVVALSVLGEISVPFVRPRFVLNADEDVFTPEIVGATIGLGAVLSWDDASRPISGDDERARSAL